MEKTREEVLWQLRQASRGVENKIKENQTATGIKDKVASHWINKLVLRARELKTSNPTLSDDSISDQCMEWLATQTSCPMNPLLDVPSECNMFSLHVLYRANTCIILRCVTTRS